VAGPPPLSGARKAAILLLTLGADVSADIMRHFTEREIEELTLEISKIRELPSQAVGPVVEEFAQLAQAHGYILQGGLTSARDLLHKALGKAKSDEILDRLSLSFSHQVFTSLSKADPRQLSDFLRREHPQTVALILANLDPETAALVLTNLAPEVRVDIVQRLATMETTSPEILKQVDQVLEKRLASVFTQEVSVVGGTKAVAEILNHVDRPAEKGIFEALEPLNPQLTEEIRRQMFTFDDLVRLDDRGIQRLLKDVEQKDLAMALKAASDGVRSKILSNLSERAQNLLRQEIEYLGPARLKDVQDAQAAIVRTVRQLEDAGEIFIASHDAGDVLV
jgi:flagellar motor switch protein FliG